MLYTFDDDFNIIDESEIENNLSNYGNHFITISKADIDDLFHCKILHYNNGEYGIFIKLA